MEKRKLKPKDIIRDIRAGVDDPTLMLRYSLSAQALQSVFNKLVQAGMITQSELEERVPMAERTVDIGLYICPACGNIQANEFTECPRCGYEVPGYLKKQREAEAKEQPARPAPAAKGHVHKEEKAPAAPDKSKPAPAAPADKTDPVEQLRKLAGYCRFLGVGALVCYALVIAAVFVLTQLALPPGTLSMTQSILVVSAMAIPILVVAIMAFVTLNALAESIKIFVKIAGPR